MDITKLLNNSINNNAKPKGEQLMIIHNGKKPYGEADFDDAGSFDDFMSGGDTGFDNMDTGMSSDADMGNDDFGFMDDYGDSMGGDNQVGSLPKDALEFLDTVDEAELNLTEKILRSYSSLYNDQLTTYNKLLTENLDASEYADDVKIIKNQYKTTLNILKEYIVNKFKNETTKARMEEFIEFKFIFIKLNESINRILKDISK